MVATNRSASSSHGKCPTRGRTTSSAFGSSPANYGVLRASGQAEEWRTVSELVTGELGSVTRGDDGHGLTLAISFGAEQPGYPWNAGAAGRRERAWPRSGHDPAAVMY